MTGLQIRVPLASSEEHCTVKFHCLSLEHGEVMTARPYFWSKKLLPAFILSPSFPVRERKSKMFSKSSFASVCVTVARIIFRNKSSVATVKGRWVRSTQFKLQLDSSRWKTLCCSRGRTGSENGRRQQQRHWSDTRAALQRRQSIWLNWLRWLDQWYSSKQL